MSVSDSLRAVTLITFDELPEHVDLLVIGAGLAGLELSAHATSFGNATVLVVERGPAHSVAHINAAFSQEAAERLWTVPSGDARYWSPWRTETPPHFEVMSGLRRSLRRCWVPKATEGRRVGVSFC